MQTRIVLLVALASTVGGCAIDGPSPMALGSVSALVSSTSTEVDPNQVPKKTMSDKVLAAIAFERVTGFTPDPSRLAP